MPYVIPINTFDITFTIIFILRFICINSNNLTLFTPYCTKIGWNSNYTKTKQHNKVFFKSTAYGPLFVCNTLREAYYIIMPRRYLQWRKINVWFSLCQKLIFRTHFEFMKSLFFPSCAELCTTFFKAAIMSYFLLHMWHSTEFWYLLSVTCFLKRLSVWVLKRRGKKWCTFYLERLSSS